MTDIFISYARQDRDRVTPVVEQLVALGWDVWWDPDIPAGKEFDELIEEQLQAARCVIVIWSETSVQSRWVRGEAREGADRGVLVPVAIDPVKPPIDLRAIHTVNLSRWNGKETAPEFGELAHAVRTLAGEPGAAETDAGYLRERAERKKEIRSTVERVRSFRSFFYSSFTASIVVVFAIIYEIEIKAEASALYTLNRWFADLGYSLGLGSAPLYVVLLLLCLVAGGLGVLLRRHIDSLPLISLFIFMAIMTFFSLVPPDLPTYEPGEETILSETVPDFSD